jgi:hypothetical protein
MSAEIKSGDGVRYLAGLMAAASPEWRGGTATVIDVLGPYAGKFARLKMDDDGSIRDGIS